MAVLKTYPYPNSAILRLNSERQFIDVEPPYQRRGDIWTLEKKQLLIDSILNDYDIPKLYFHSISRKQKSAEGGEFDFAIIDGRQRLQTIWSFIDGSFPLADDFVYLADETVNAGGMTYSKLASEYPKLKIRFDSFTLPIVCLETDDLDVIEDMFSRLNEAVPLSAAEKRNAIGGPMAQCIRDVADHEFFKSKVRFSNRRYQHREVAAHLLFIEFSIAFNNRLLDTKKPYLDDMVRQYKEGKAHGMAKLRARTLQTLNLLDSVFISEDSLLRSQGTIPVYYLTLQGAEKAHKLKGFTRDKLTEFNNKLSENRAFAETDIAKANFEWLEFDRMSQQGTNDATSIKERVKILSAFLGFSSDLDRV
ncbi:MAG: DUF262 domain-containing protein [Nitrososphaerales archaeon]